ncbi:Legume-like lectin family protein [Aspergillus niger]|uniref:Legume-like lectin family protein n=1 Tax=Aspergillus niger TaxID=5061 RepID=A0A505I787_ASPNG|nr:Legume-like lectin family protein [Aspergillus niger]
MALAIEQSQRLLGMAREGFGASGSDAQVCLGDRRLNPGHRFERYECTIHQEECRYQPSRRGGPRRGPVAAAELAKKRARRLAERSWSYIQNGDSDYPHDSRIREPNLLQLDFLSPTESLQQLRSNSLENNCTEISSPLHGLGDVVENVLGSMAVPKWSIRVYQCDQDLINAYYIYIHPYLPFLPPPAVPQYEDKCVAVAIRSTFVAPTEMPYWPVSPLALALAGILVLLPVPGESHPPEHETIALRRSYADLFARSALELLEDSIESSSEGDMAKTLRSSLHPAVPRKLEAVYALGILSLYECCQKGNISRMRIRANQALTVAMDMSLHKGTAHDNCSDAQRRCWWATILLVYQSSIMIGSAPVVTIDDHRITTAFPEFRGCREPWPLLMHAQETLLRSCEVGRLLITEGDHPNLSYSIRDEIQSLDSLILKLAAEVDRFRCVTNYEGPEADASRNLWAISNALIHTARLILHRVRAFPDCTILTNDYYDYLAIGINQASHGAAHDFHLSTGRIAEINALFPFTEQESVHICLHSALAISRIFRRLPVPSASRYTDTAEAEAPIPWLSWQPLASPRSVPYLACCQLQSFGILAVVLCRVRMATRSGNLASYSYLLDRPGSCSTRVQDAERLIEELQSGMEALGRSIQADTVFEGIIGVAKEVKRIWKRTVMD